MDKIVIESGIDGGTGLKTQIEFSNLNIGQPMPHLLGQTVTIGAKKQWLKKDGVTVHNEEAIQLGVNPDDSEEVKNAKEAAIAIFKTGMKPLLTKLLTALKPL
jgi:hypothetical protein